MKQIDITSISRRISHPKLRSLREAMASIVFAIPDDGFIAIRACKDDIVSQ